MENHAQANTRDKGYRKDVPMEAKGTGETLRRNRIYVATPKILINWDGKGRITTVEKLNQPNHVVKLTSPGIHQRHTCPDLMHGEGRFTSVVFLPKCTTSLQSLANREVAPTEGMF